MSTSGPELDRGSHGRAAAENGAGDTVLGSSVGLDSGSLTERDGSDQQYWDQQYIVALEDASALVEVATGLDADGVTITNTWTGALTGLTARLDEAGARSLQELAGVVSVEPDAEMKLSGTQGGAPWSLDRIDQSALPLNGTYSYAESGAGVTAYVIDSGLRPTHAEFRGRVPYGTFWDFGDGLGYTDCHGHGTHVAASLGGATWGVAKAVSIVPIRVSQCSGTLSTSIVVEGINWAIQNHPYGVPAVMNLSLGGATSFVLDDAVGRAMNDGITVVVAAGNDANDSCYRSPGHVPAVITVAASDQRDNDSGLIQLRPMQRSLCTRREHHVGELRVRSWVAGHVRNVDGGAARDRRRGADLATNSFPDTRTGVAHNVC